MERLCEILNFDWKGSGEYFSLQEGDVCRVQRWVKEYLWPRGCTGVAFATVVNYWLLLSHLRRLTGVSWQDVGYLSAGALRAMQCLPHLSHSAPLATPMACPHQGPFLQLWCWKEDTWNWPTKDINCEWEINQRSIMTEIRWYTLHGVSARNLSQQKQTNHYFNLRTVPFFKI